MPPRSPRPDNHRPRLVTIGHRPDSATPDTTARTRNTSQHSRLATVWPQPTAANPGRWQAAILTLATRYTPPGAHILLLDPPTTAWAPGEHTMAPASPAGSWIGPGEAAQAVARLGRAVHVRTADSQSDRGTPAGRSESGPRPTASRPGPDHRHRRRGRRNGPEKAPDTVATRSRFDLIATAVAPHDPGWVTALPFANLLTPAGTLAVFTHADNTGPQLVDPTGALVDTLSDRGLVWAEHVILPATPLDDPGPATTRPDASDSAGARHRVTHGDLLLFHPATARRAPRRPHNEETPDA